ncbi:MAG TPA: hypothetical protein VNL35_14645 [Chloroflexota bacterium]|nr:hypothetical protein [Chloroflexota bacterium]
MQNVTMPYIERTNPGTLPAAAFAEVCERLIRTQSLLADPHHLSRKQGSAMARLLQAGLHAVGRQLDALRRPIFAPEPDEPARTLSGLGIASAGLRQVQAHLGYLGSRWPLGTSDLFVRKLVAEGMPLPVPTLCPVDLPEATTGEIGAELRERLLEAGLWTAPPASDSPVLVIPTTDLLDPLTWAAVLYPLAAVVVERQDLASRLRGPSRLDEDGVRRLCVAGVAARLVGEATFAARASKALVARLGGESAGSDLGLLAQASEPYALSLETGGYGSLTECFRRRLREQGALGSAWGRQDRDAEDQEALRDWSVLDDFVAAGLPAPQLPTAEDVERLVALLADGRPINALPPLLPSNFGTRLEEGADADRFYSVLAHAGERPCSLATILAGGWQYKMRHSLPLCATLMAADRAWNDALEPYAAHVHERSALLQQSIEGAYVQQVFTRWKDQ